MKIALFSDIHGKFLLPFLLVDAYQKETGNHIDLILQCGDMGAYPDIAKLDKATIRHAKNDSDELGFHDDFVTKDANIEAFLEELNIPMICVRGNHEDHEFLDTLEQQYKEESRFPIDVYKYVWVCKSGVPQVFESNGETLSFLGVGRIGDRKGRGHGAYIQDYEREVLKHLYKKGKDFDVLITHDQAQDRPDDYGMSELGTLLDKVLFEYHFYGHTGAPFHQQLDDNGITQSIKIKELEFNTNGALDYGSMLILNKDIDGHLSLEIVSTAITNQFTKHSWKYIR